MFKIRAHDPSRPRAFYVLRLSNNIKLLCTIALCLSLLLGSLPQPAQAVGYVAPQRRTYVRYEAHTPQGQQNLRSLRVALEKMKAMGCDDPRSWYYQGAMHWVPTRTANISGLQAENPLCPRYSDFPESPNDPFPGNSKLLASWDNCTHAPNQAGQNSVVHFLPWHRLYVHHFEKIVRDLANDPNFSLPYWGYISLLDTELPDAERLTMPLEFRGPADATNSLYEAARDRSLTAGDPLNTDFAQENLLDAVEGLSRQKVYADFNQQIDVRPHGLMHVYLGGAINGDTDIFNPIYNRAQTDDGAPQFGLMTNVPSAGFDPIFWMHHGNIDRLWAQWTQETGVRVTAAELEQATWPYQFFEPNGEVAAYTMQAAVDAVYNMDYVYDDGTSPNPPATTPVPTLMANQPEKTLLGRQQTKATVGSNQELNQTVPLSQQIRPPSSALPENRLAQPNYTLEVAVTYTGQPRGLYKVYLNLPTDEADRTVAIADTQTYFVGTISFFVLGSDRPTTKTFQFDITDELLLQIQNQDDLDLDAASISIQKQGGPAAETLTIENMAIYARD